MPISIQVTAGRTEGCGPSQGIKQTEIQWSGQRSENDSFVSVLNLPFKKLPDESATNSARHILITVYKKVPDYCKQDDEDGLLCHIYNLGLRCIIAS